MDEPPLPPKHLQEIRHHVAIKITLLGDEEVGKTCLMRKFVNGDFDTKYTRTLGVNFMDKLNNLEMTEIKYNIYDLGGSKEFENMLPLAISESVAICYVFDLTNKESLESVKKWWKLSKLANLNSDVVPILVGTKYDQFVNMPEDHQKYIHFRSLQFANALGSPLVFTSSSGSINIQKVLKIILRTVFDLSVDLPEYVNVGEPLLMYKRETVNKVLAEKS